MCARPLSESTPEGGAGPKLGRYLPFRAELVRTIANAPVSGDRGL
jgi:hypothetical protein